MDEGAGRQGDGQRALCGPITRTATRTLTRSGRPWGCRRGTKEIKLDLADKKFAQLYMDVLHKPALDMGMAFWWQDGNVPFQHAGARSAPLDAACRV